MIAGLALVGVCIFVVWAVSDLSVGSVKYMGPAMFPRALAVMLGAAGVYLVIESFLRDGEPLAKISVRGPAMVTLGILLFAATIRPFGLAIATMLALVVSGFATKEARPVEVVIFAAAVTLACIIVFRYVLDMSVQVIAIPGTSIGF